MLFSLPHHSAMESAAVDNGSEAELLGDFLLSFVDNISYFASVISVIPP